MGPKPNLNQIHDSYKRQALNHVKSEFDELAKTKCPPLFAGCIEESVRPHKLPSSPSEVEDDGQFRLVVLGADYAGIVGDPPKPKAADFIRTHASATQQRTYQNIVLAVTPSVTGLSQAEQQIADRMAWVEIRKSQQFKDLDSFQQETVKKRERESLQQAQGAVKNAYEIVLYLHADGSIQAKKITIGAESLIRTLLSEKDLRLYKEKIDATAILPGGPWSVWPPGDVNIPVKDFYQAFGRQGKLPKLLNRQVVLTTIEDAVRRGVLALRCTRSDGSVQWYWRSPIDMTNWDEVAEAWLPEKAKLENLSQSAVIPNSLKGLWPEDDRGVKLSELYSWFDGNHAFEEQMHPDYPAEERPIPTVDYAVVQQAVSGAVTAGSLWLVFGNDSVFKEKPSAIQLDADAVLYRPPQPVASIDFLPSSLPGVWSTESEPKTEIEKVYAEIKTLKGRPWPEREFLNALNSAIAQGFIHRVTGTGPVASLQHDGKIALIIKTSAPPPPPPPPMSGRRRSNTVQLSVSEVQTLGEEIARLTKLLAGGDPVVEACITVKDKGDIDVKGVEECLRKIKKDWKF
ncbi:MAG: hypothetical protein ABSC19_15295 [Syntrophorhabdales bacterium]